MGRSAPTSVPPTWATGREGSFIQFRYLETRRVNGTLKEGEEIQFLPTYHCYTNRIVTVVKFESLKNLPDGENLLGCARRQITIWMEPDAGESSREYWTGWSLSFRTMS